MEILGNSLESDTPLTSNFCFLQWREVTRHKLLIALSRDVSCDSLIVKSGPIFLNFNIPLSVRSSTSFAFHESYKGEIYVNISLTYLGTRACRRVLNKHCIFSESDYSALKILNSFFTTRKKEICYNETTQSSLIGLQ